MKSPRHKRILLSLYLIMRATWPYGFGEILSTVSMKLVNRIVFMLLMLRNFRLFSRNVDSTMNFVEVFDKMQPILWSTLAVLILPALVEVVGTISEKRRKRRSTPDVVKRYCYIMYGSSRIRDDWTRAYNAQKSILEHLLFICLVAPLFLWYSWPVFVTFLVVTNVYVWLCIPKPRKITGYFTRFVADGAYVNLMKNFFFCIYLVICAFIIWLTPGKFSLEFLFLLIVGMRMQMGRASNLVDALRSGALKRPEKAVSA